ncbi:ShlB/FhaC/HecB family hemolysin secretion/activation protein [Novosphingobium sp.]|uniref:ShlB/FhaC/HecB family hemolysin secretion/activation protein n=1 Tax=Novosphingobium sp. TaxID=1874826 RepID=UPI0027341F15|nr:ShlB/FhaC/HecB family hemolysin secretion/activation protein [Novosphingobium sp.]MDP3905733.1 ShlB/FhaC/HecB family hemolysin secretion/activation protein [Novosphingobium sp.]
MAQQVPDAGQQIQQIPPPPQSRITIPDIRITSKDTPVASASDGTRIRVDALHVTGQTVFVESELIAATGFKPGGELALGDLRNAAMKITNYYNSRGYPLAQAYVPAQDVSGGRVTIAVIEGRYGAIDVQNHSSLGDRQARAVLHGLDSGDVVASAPLERRLLLLSDIPGVAVNATLKPGTLEGTSDLVVNVEPGRRVTGVIEADNAGNRYTGEYRLGGTVNFNNITGHGDVASFRLLASNLGMVYGRVAYQTQFGLATVGVSYAHIRYALGREFKSLDASGTADIASIYASYPLIRSRDHNLFFVTAAEAKWFKDKVRLTGSETDRTTRSLMVGLNGSFHDSLGGGAWSTYSISATIGTLRLKTPLDLADDALTARSDGNYAKLQLSASRLQTLVGPLSLYGSIRGQLASKNLDSSERMELGGAYGVRAYPEGEAYGDEGYLATIEARLTLPALSASLPGQVQLIGFVDTGAVTLAKNPWFAGSNSAHRSGYGVGVTWSDPGNFIVKAAYSRKIGNTAATSAPDRSGRFWIQIAKFF